MININILTLTSLNIPTQLTSNLGWHEETGLAKKKIKEDEGGKKFK